MFYSDKIMIPQTADKAYDYQLIVFQNSKFHADQAAFSTSELLTAEQC